MEPGDSPCALPQQMFVDRVQEIIGIELAPIQIVRYLHFVVAAIRFELHFEGGASI
jgi:hypothetical protein